MFRSSLRHLLTAPPSVIHDVYGVHVGAGFQVVGEAGSGEETVSVVESVRPDLLLLDLSMPRMSGLDALVEMAAHRESMRTVLLAGVIDKAHLLTAVQLGVGGVVVKDSTTELLFEAIVSVLGGRFWLGQTLVSDLIELVRTLSQTAGSPANKRGLGLTRRERARDQRMYEPPDRDPVLRERRDDQAPSHADVRQGRRLQPARACDEGDAKRLLGRPLNG
jgi:DNA-binding NarL/FixJ family response regulator